MPSNKCPEQFDKYISLLNRSGIRTLLEKICSENRNSYTDGVMCLNTCIGEEKRMIDLLLRHGVFAKIHYYT